MIQGESDGVQCLFSLLWLQLTLPYSDTMPTHFRQLTLLLFISLLIPANFVYPKLPVRLWNLAALAINYQL